MQKHHSLLVHLSYHAISLTYQAHSTDSFIGIKTSSNFNNLLKRKDLICHLSHLFVP